MPDKEGSDDEKTTKGVVKKKQKQMMGEEGYDTYRDNILMRGGDHRSKETREKSYTPSKQSKGKTAAQKAAKGKSALELVKADITKKYGKGAIMDVGKKKANEELDLTKIAEAFGGYVVEANGKNGKKNGKKSDIDDFIGAEDPFNVQAQKDAQRDIEQTGGTDTRSSFSRQDSFQKSGKFKQPEKNPLRKKGGRIKADSVKFTQRPGEKPVKSYIDPSQIDSKIAAREKVKRKQSKKKPTAAELARDRDKKLGAKSFKKDIGGEKIISPTMKDRLEKATEGPRRARKRRSDAASLAQVKADIDTADAARKAKGKGEYASDYEKRLSKAYDKSLEGTAKTGRAPAGQVLPQAKTKTPQGQPQKGQSDQSDAAQEFNKQQNILRRLQRQGMADSGATPFKQPPLPDPKTGPSSKLTFSKFQQDQQKRFDQNKKDMEAADAYKQTPEYKLQTRQVDPNTGQLLSKDELKRRFQMQRKGNQQQIDKETPKDQGRVDLNRDSLKSGIGGFKRGRQGTLTRSGKKPPKVSTSTGATGGGKEPSLVSKVAKFSKENPATALLSLDALRRFMPSSSPFGVSGGRVGRRSAPS